MTRHGGCAWALALLLTASLGAQTTVFVASRVDATWVDDEHLWVQAGRRLHRLASIEGQAPVGRSAEGRSVPHEASFFDVRDGQALFVGDRAFGPATAGHDVDGTISPLLRRPLAGSPVRLPLLLDGGGFVVPGRPEFLCHWAVGSPPVAMTSPSGGALELGWGIGDPLAVDLVVPHLLRYRAASRRGVVVGLDSRWALHFEDGGSVALMAPPRDDEIGILEFPFSVPPVMGDLDGDGADDLVVVDPSAGSAAVYRQLADPAPGPTRVILVSGLCLAAWVDDFDDDGQPDLGLLRARKPGFAGQLKILKEGLLNAEFLLYPGVPGEGLPKSPRLRVKVEVGIAIGIENETREAAFTSMCVPRSGGLLASTPTGALMRYPWTGGDPVEVGVLPAGRALEAFVGHAVGNGCAFGWSDAGADRVVWVKDE